MRLNRVLLLAAVISMAMIAMVFTISCSDGANGKDGDVCTVSATEGGYNVTCGGNSAGQLTHGPAGAPGETGTPGTDGVPGPDCGLTLGIGGIYNITCAGELRGVLEGCKTTAINQEISIACVGSSIISLCGGITFTPTTQYCDYNSTTNASSIEPIGGNVCGPTQTPYNPGQKYCGYASEEAYIAKSPSVLPLCIAPAGATPDPSNTPPSTDSAASRPNWAGPVSKTSLQATDPEDWALKGGVTSWQDEYCSVSRKIQYTNATDKVQMRSPLVVYKTAKATLCGGVLTKFNEDSFKGEYCGFADAEAVLPSKVDNACGDGRGPDSAAFNRAYCQMAKKDDYYTEVQYNYCNEGPEGAIKSTINRVDKFTLLTKDDWKNGGEYCAYTSEENAEAGIKTKRTGICDDGKAPNDTAQGRQYNNQYCQVTLASWLANKTNPRTVVTKAQEAYCLKENANGNAWKTAGAVARVNENIWRNQYCGYATKEDADSTRPSVIGSRKVCTAVTALEDGRIPIGPNSNQAGYGWSNAYCMAKSPGALSEYVAGTEDAVVITPLSGTTKTYKAYCNAYAPGFTIPTVNNPNGRYNEDEWQSQYCGYASKTDFDGGVSGLATIPARTVTVMSPHCDDGNAPNSVAGPDTGLAVVNGVNVGFYRNQYCQIPYGERNTGKTAVAGLPRAGTFTTDIFESFCIPDTTITVSVDVSTTTTPDMQPRGITGSDAAFRQIYGSVSLPSQRLNEKPAGVYSRWPSQYCGFESKAAMEAIKPEYATIANAINTASNRKPVFSRLQGVCDGVSTELVTATVESATGVHVGPNRAGRPIAKTVWLAEYCQVAPANGGKPTGTQRTTTTLVGLIPNIGQTTPTTYAPTSTAVVDATVYCWEGSVPASGNTVQDVYNYSASSLVSRSLNRGSWQGQFCFKNAQRGTCRENQVPVGYGTTLLGNTNAACFASVTSATVVSSATTQATCELPIGNWSTAYCADNKTCGTGGGENCFTTLPTTKAACEVSIYTWNPTSICSVDPTNLTTEALCIAPKGTWGFDETNGICSKASVTTNKTDCEATNLNTWTDGSCSDGTSPNATDCGVAGETWTPDACSDATLTSAGQQACELPKGQWSADPTHGICSADAGILTTQALCTAPKGIWQAGSSTVGTCTDNSSSTQTACETSKKGNWEDASCGECSASSTYTTNRPTPTTKLTCEAKNTWTASGTGTCSVDPTNLTTEALCIAPKGTWGFDETNGICSKASVTTNKTDCEAANLNTWTDGSCSDGTSPNATDCGVAGETWTPDACSDATLTSAGQQACELPKGQWSADPTHGICSADAGILTTQALCTAPKGIWEVPGTCSDTQYTTQSTCIAASIGTWHSISGNYDVNQATCNSNKGIWLYSGGVKGTNVSGGTKGLAFRNAGEVGACQ